METEVCTSALVLTCGLVRSHCKSVLARSCKPAIIDNEPRCMRIRIMLVDRFVRQAVGKVR